MSYFVAGIAGAAATLGVLLVATIHAFAPGFIASYLPKWLRDMVGTDF